MSQKLRDLVESAIKEVLSEVSWEGYEGEDLEATCNHCGQDLWLVWDASNPIKKWTECGGIGEGSCHARLGYDPDEDLEHDIEPAPPTLRSPERVGASTKVKRSV